MAIKRYSVNYVDASSRRVFLSFVPHSQLCEHTTTNIIIKWYTVVGYTAYPCVGVLHHAVRLGLSILQSRQIRQRRAETEGDVQST